MSGAGLTPQVAISLLTLRRGVVPALWLGSCIVSSIRKFAWVLGAAVALAGAAQADNFGFGGSVAAGETRTWTVTFGPSAIFDASSPDLLLVAHGLFFDLVQYGDGPAFEQYNSDYLASGGCHGLGPNCIGSVGAGSGPATYSLTQLGNQLILTVANTGGSYDHCASDNTHLCAVKMDPLQVAGRLGFEGAADATVFEQLGGVPEPASWALMITGFGMIGGALRSRRPRARLA